jgi:hypothetical protein
VRHWTSPTERKCWHTNSGSVWNITMHGLLFIPECQAQFTWTECKVTCSPHAIIIFCPNIQPIFHILICCFKETLSLAMPQFPMTYSKFPPITAVPWLLNWQIPATASM